MTWQTCLHYITVSITDSSKETYYQLTIHYTIPVRNRKSKGKSKKDAEAVASGDMDAVDGAVAGTENGTTSSPDQESGGRM